MDYHLYTYISSTKVNLLYDQIHRSMFSEVGTEAGATIGGLSAKVSAKKNMEENIYQKLDYVREELIRNKKTGNLLDPTVQFIIDTFRFQLQIVACGNVYWLYSYYNESNMVLYRILMYGSQENILGTRPEGTFGIGSHAELAIPWLKRVERLAIENGGDIEAQDEKYYNRWTNFLFSKTLEDESYEKWKTVEDMITLSHITLSPVDFGQKIVFARLDYRETITRKEYEKSYPTKKKLGNNSMDAYLDPLMPPSTVQKIVYMYASPISVEYVQYDSKVNIINGRTYLYIPIESMELIKINAGDPREVILEIYNQLVQNKLREEAEQFLGEYRELLLKNERIGYEQVNKILKKYITSEPPL